MFGDDDQDQNSQQTTTDDSQTTVEPTTADPMGSTSSTDDTSVTDSATSVTEPTISPAPAADPVVSETPDPVSEPVSNPMSVMPTEEPAAATPAAADSAVNNDLLEIKQKALEQLTPIVSHLDQTPEEKFRTTMMMIQASDNQALIKDAYEAAQGITDEKSKAQALLDIVNEINYFTQNAE